MHRDTKSQLQLWNEDDVNEGQDFYEWLISHQRHELVSLLALEGPHLWHCFVVDMQKLQRHSQKIADLFLSNAQRSCFFLFCEVPCVHVCGAGTWNDGIR